METNPQTPPQGNKPNVMMAILAYIGPLIIISYLTVNDDPFVKFHIKQGLLLFIGSLIVWALSSFFWSFWMFINIINLAIFILAIIGIINAAKGEQKELPLVGHFAKNFNF